MGSADYLLQAANLDEKARRAIGVRTFEEVHARGVPAKGWLLDRLERNVTLV